MMNESEMRFVQWEQLNMPHPAVRMPQIVKHHIMCYSLMSVIGVHLTHRFTQVTHYSTVVVAHRAWDWMSRHFHIV